MSGLTKSGLFLMGVILGGICGYVVSQVVTVKSNKFDREETQRRIAYFWADLYSSKKTVNMNGTAHLYYDPDSLYLADEVLIDDTTKDELIDTIWVSTASGFIPQNVIWSRFIWDDSTSSWKSDTIQDGRPDRLERKWRFKTR